MVEREGQVGPRQLATRISRLLASRNDPPMDRAALAHVLTTLYRASFMTEEGQAVRLRVVVGSEADLRRQQGSGDGQGFPVEWRIWPLARPIELSVESVSKLALATDPRNGALSVEIGHAGATIWAIVDQLDHAEAAMTWGTHRLPSRPGRLQVVIQGVGHLHIWHGYEKVGELRGVSLLPREVDVFAKGPVRRALDVGYRAHLDEVRSAVTPEERDLMPDEAELARQWFDTVRGVLLRMRSYGVGGGLLVTNDSTLATLDVKYGIQYSRLRSAVRARAVNRVRLGTHESRPSERAKLVEERDAIRRELESVTRFVALLTRIDGNVVLTPRLDIVGFGARIETPPGFPAEPGGTIGVAFSSGGAFRRRVGYAEYGTRHQSILRYCQAFDGSVGFIMSHDGAARAVTRVAHQVRLWDGIRLERDHEFAGRQASGGTSELIAN